MIIKYIYGVMLSDEKLKEIYHSGKTHAVIKE